MKALIAFCAALVIASPALSKTVKILQPLTPGIVGALQIVETRVALNDATKENFEKLEAKAARKRAEAGLSAGAEVTTGARPTPEQYATLPVVQMFPLVVEDEARAWGLTNGRQVRLNVTFDTLKTADAGMAMLLGSSDQLAGQVDVEDAGSGEKLGAFYIDIINMRAGLMGLALRGSGVREKLATEFSKRLVQQLSGAKRKPGKA